jgi:hypothetical protein
MSVPALLCIMEMTRYQIPGLAATAGDVSLFGD